MRFTAICFLVLLTVVPVHAAPNMQTAPVSETLSAIIGVGGLGMGALFMVALVISRIPNKGANDVLLKTAQNNSEALELANKQFEADKKDREERNRLEAARINAQLQADAARDTRMGELLGIVNRHQERSDNTEKALISKIEDDTQAKRKLAESMDAMTKEDSRHNQEIEDRVKKIEGEVIAIRKAVGDDTIGTITDMVNRLTGVEKLLKSLHSLFEEKREEIPDVQPQPE